MKYKLCVWDLDGTILNSLPTLNLYDNKALEKYGLGQITLEQSKSLIKHSIEDYYTTLLRLGNCEEERIPTILNEFTEYDLSMYSENFLNESNIFEGVSETVDKLNDLGIMSVAFTNKPDNIAKDIIKSFFDKRMPYTFGQRYDSIPKPHKGCTDQIVEATGISTDNMIIIGDTEVDLLTANNNNIDSVAVTWGYQDLDVLKKYNPTYIINCPNELLKIIKE